MAIHYTKTNWLNNEAPAINQSNLNKIEQGIYDATEALNDRVQTVNSQSPDADGNVELQTLPSGGTAGQTIIKQSATEGDAIWADLNAIGLDASDVALGSGTVEDLAGSIATIETSPATANHAVGDLIIYNGQLNLVTTAITAGSTLDGKITPTTADAQFAHTRIVTSGSMNSLTKSGIYYCTSAVTDVPLSGGGVLIIGAYNSETASATYISYVTAGAVAFGKRNANGWTWVHTPNLTAVTVSGTTSSSGAIEVPIEHRAKLFVSATMTSQAGFVFRRDSSYFTVMNNDLNSAIANTAVTFTAYFLSI